MQRTAVENGQSSSIGPTLIKVVGGKSKIRREIEEAITKKKLLKVKISNLKEGMKEIKLNEKPQRNLLRQSHVPLV